MHRERQGPQIKLESQSILDDKSSTSKIRVSIPMVVQREEVYMRDQCCQYQDKKTQTVCGSKWRLNIDHIQPVWAGGTNEIKNLRLLCAKHNRHVYKKQSGLERYPVARI